jgi:hypothetical protein
VVKLLRYKSGGRWFDRQSANNSGRVRSNSVNVLHAKSVRSVCVYVCLHTVLSESE